MKQSRQKTIRSYAIITALACLMSLNYQIFIFPNSFAPAGINGLATMVQHLFGFNIGYMSLIVNIPLILVAWKTLTSDFARKSLLFVLVFSVASLLFKQVDFSAVAYQSGHSAILGPVAAGVVSGAVYGCVIRQNGSTGGTDILAAWVHKLRPEISLVGGIFALNAFVAAVSFFVYGYQFEPVILCLIYCYLTSRISNMILQGGKTALKFEVITQNAAALSARLLQELHHGVTVLPAQGMYSATPRSLLICVVNRHQIVRFQEILAEFPGAFAYVSTISETMGNFQRASH